MNNTMIKDMKEIHIGESIEKRRNQLMLTKTELAQRIGVSRQRLNSILAKPTIDTSLLIKICEAMDCNFFTLYCPEYKNDTSLKLNNSSACGNVQFSEKDNLMEIVKVKDAEISFYKEKNEELHKMVDLLLEKNKSVDSLGKQQ